MTIWAIIPAAGVGTRMQAAAPKQYLLINGQAVLAHTVARLNAVSSVERIVVALHPQDDRWATLGLYSGPRLQTCVGGADRCHSVLNALNALREDGQEDDWVLVHDAVRPCVSVSDIERLLAEVADHPVGGLLAVPVSSTLKRAGPEGDVSATVDRTDIWQAGTPQVFRYGLLHRTLTEAIAAGTLVTDEASALELAGFAPRLVRGRADNIKITYPEDLLLARLILEAQRLEERSVEKQK
ncbi:MAG: 2-C-methyl-D-erythritol 4-phosphate cytidylyltransferase [Pseudomonadota bacterium]